MFVFSVYRLVSRRCHAISTVYPLAPAPHRTGRADFPHPALQSGSQVSSVNPTFESLAAIPDSRFSSVDNVFPGSEPCIVSLPRYTCLSTPSLHRHYPVSLVLWIDPTTCTSSSNLVPSVPSTPFQRKIQVLPGSQKIPFNNMPWTMTPVEYPPSRL